MTVVAVSTTGAGTFSATDTVVVSATGFSVFGPSVVVIFLVHRLAGGIGNQLLKDRGITLHGLRHSHASHMLAENIHPKIVQERLGHSSIGITLDIYSRLMPNMQGDAAKTVDGVMRAAINKPDDETIG